MNYKHCYVIDKNSYYKDFVLVLLEPDGEGGTRENIQAYTLQEGETLINANPPSGYVRPVWDGDVWQEGATDEEIAAAEAAKAQEVVTSSEGASNPTLDERITAVEDALLVLALGGVTVE